MANVNNLPYISPAEIPTCIATTLVVACTFVKIAAGGVGNRPKVTTATGADAAFGVAMTDAAIGQDVGTWRSGVVPVTAGVALTAGDIVYPDGTGKAIKTAGAGPRAGICVADTASGSNAPIALTIG